MTHFHKVMFLPRIRMNQHNNVDYDYILMLLHKMYIHYEDCFAMNLKLVDHVRLQLKLISQQID